MDKEKILSYVMNSPSNTNPNVLRTLLDAEGGGSSDFSVATINFENGSKAQIGFFGTSFSSETKLIEPATLIESGSDVAIKTVIPNGGGCVGRFVYPNTGIPIAISDMTVEGAAEALTGVDDTLYITGDCVITFTVSPK